MTRYLWILLLCGCSFDLSALGPHVDGGLQDAEVTDASVDAAIVEDATTDSGEDSGILLADADVDSSSDDAGSDVGIDAWVEDDAGSDADFDAWVETDAELDAGTCEPTTTNGDAIGSRCSCPTGYWCYFPPSGSGSCQILCEQDCDCPSGYTCMMPGSDASFDDGGVAKFCNSI